MYYSKKTLNRFVFWISLIVLIYFRENMLAVYISAGLLWTAILVNIVSMFRLPRALKYIGIEFFPVLIFLVYIIWTVFEIKNRIERFGLDWDYIRIYSIAIPMVMLHCLRLSRSSYLYDEGIVIKGEALDFSQMDSFEWKKTAVYTLFVRYGGSKYSVMLNEKKFKLMDEKLLSEGVDFAGWTEGDE